MRDRSRPLVWFHAPSVGEGLQARAVIDALRQRRPDIQVAYSFFSPSAESFARALNVDLADYLPFDSRGAANALIDVLRPDALFFSKLDVWPNLVAKASTRGVVTGLLSGTVAPRSGRQGAWAGALLRDAYAALDIVGAIDAANGDRLRDMGVVPSRLTVSGDTRFDQVWERAARVNRGSPLLVQLQAARPTLVAGSTWPADEAVLLPAWLEIRKQYPTARLIIAPHEPTPAHLTPVQAWAQQHGLSSVALSALGIPGEANTRSTDSQVPPSTDREAANRTPRDADVILVDRVGVLGDIYAVANVAYVGGGFHRAGLHSVLEPAAYGVPVVFGPGYGTSREAALLLERNGARSVSSIDQGAQAIGEWLGSGSAREASGNAAVEFVRSELGAAERSLDLVLRALG